MSAPERLFIVRLHDGKGDITEELRVCLVEQLGDHPGDKAVVTATPRAADLGCILEHCSDEWLHALIADLQRRSPTRATVVARALSAEPAPRLAAHACTCSSSGPWPVYGSVDSRRHGNHHPYCNMSLVRHSLTHESSAAGDIGDFGICPGDSQALLELRQAIDTHLGWLSSAEEQAGNYVERIAQAGGELSGACLQSGVSADATWQARCEALEKKVRRQRIELRRFNREAQTRAEARRQVPTMKTLKDPQ